MLWYYHDMQAGYFPLNWINIMITEGASEGIQLGWIVVMLSYPYNLLGAAVCFFLTKRGAELFTTRSKIELMNFH
jgi:hypothetical protein